MIDTLTREQIDALEVTYYGPTWQRGPLGNFAVPELTLGWQVAEWCTEYLKSIDDPDNPDAHWTFTNEQFRFILWWYAVDERGRFVYRTGVLQRLKGWGKDPLAAVMCLVEFVGPCRVSHFDPEAPGGVVGKAHPTAWVQVAAVSREQTRNTMTMFPALMSQLLMDTYGIKDGVELIRAHMGRCRIEAVTSSYRALEGGRSTFIILNETHHWIRGNNGDLMYQTIWGNATKMNGRYLAITNAYMPGEDSVAEKMRYSYEQILEGRAENTGFMYDTIEANASTPMTRDALEIVLPKIRGDAVWLNVETIISAIHDITIPIARSRRMWLNQIVADEDAIYGANDMKAIEREATLQPGDTIVLGFDGGRYNDSTALVAIRLKDRMTFLLGLWEKPHTWNEELRGRWQVNADAVDTAVRHTFKNFNVKVFFADVNLWESYIADWTDDYGDGLVVQAKAHGAIAWDMRGSLQESTRAHERFMSSIHESKIFYDGDLSLKRHTMNTRRDVNKYGDYFRKDTPDSSRKIDAYAAWLLAHEALHRYLTKPLPEKKKTGAGWFL